MSGLRRVGLAVAALVVGLAASFFIAKGWSPICHEGCPAAIQLSMWGFLLALPLVLAVAVFVATGRPRAVARVGLGLAAFAVLGLALTAVAAGFWGQAHGG